MIKTIGITSILALSCFAGLHTKIPSPATEGKAAGNTEGAVPGSASPENGPQVTLTGTQTLDSLGAAQGVAYIGGRIYIYGDREVGMMRAYRVGSGANTTNAGSKGARSEGRVNAAASPAGSLEYVGIEYRFTMNGKDLINHPTGIAWNGQSPTFIGNSVRLNQEGTAWKALIYAIDWEGFLGSGTLDGNLLNTIEDDACIQGTRPEYVRYKGKWAVATADYGDKRNEVRLYDPEKLLKAKRTSEEGVLVGKFSCSPWVQTLKWIPEKGVLVLVQNQIEGRRWRLSFLDFERSMQSGKEAVIKVVDIDRADELEGFTLLGSLDKGLAVSSFRKENAAFLRLDW